MKKLAALLALTATLSAPALSALPRPCLILGVESSCDETGLALVSLPLEGEPRLLARVDTFLAQARSSQALMVNAMHWFKHSLSPEMFKDGKG